MTDLEIARKASLKPIAEIAASLGIPDSALHSYGPHIAKLNFDYIRSLQSRPTGKLILVIGITPTPAGEGKTTTVVGLGDALNRAGHKSLICLREPSLGPCFGIKGGAAGGGYAQVVPMEEINLHFTGDAHAVGAAHNLLTAMLDNRVHWGDLEQVDPRQLHWNRVIDLNDRALRHLITGLGGSSEGVPRENGFDITVASEVMAILCLARDYADLRTRLGKIIVGYTKDNRALCASDIKAEGAMAALLKQAFLPNLVQTLEQTPALIHGGPFANLAHGCNSLIATDTALRLSDYTLTEAGFGADLGAEKFFNIKCRMGGLTPNAVVLVATVRALKSHAGVAQTDLAKPDTDAVIRGCANLGRHLRNLAQFGLPVIVALNHFETDSEEEQASVVSYCSEFNVRCIRCTHWAQGSIGAQELAETVVETTERSGGQFRTLYPDTLSLWEKTRLIARTLYGAEDIIADQKIRDRFRSLEERGFGTLPVCIAKTPYSFSTDPQLKGAPTNHVVPIRDLRLASGAGFVVVFCGSVLTLPGLPRVPAAERIWLTDEGEIEGLF